MGRPLATTADDREEERKAAARNLTEEEKEEENEKKNKIDRFKERKWFKRFFSLIWQVPRDLPD